MLSLASDLGIPKLVATEIIYRNDDGCPYNDSPGDRHRRMLYWVQKRIISEPPQTPRTLSREAPEPPCGPPEARD